MDWVVNLGNPSFRLTNIARFGMIRLFVQVKTAVDFFAEFCRMGVVTELVVVGGWDCVVAIVNLLGEMVACEWTVVADVDFGDGWVNVKGWMTNK